VCRRLGAHGQSEYCGMIKGLNCVEERSGRHGRLGPCRQPECCVISDPLFLVSEHGSVCATLVEPVVV